MKSKINIESFLLIYSLTFILSLVFSAIIFENLRRIFLQFNFFGLLKILFTILVLIYIWILFIKIHTKIKIDNNSIEFKGLFKNSKYNLRDLDLILEQKEPSKFKDYKVLLIKNNKIIERISEFNYSNYNELKKQY